MLFDADLAPPRLFGAPPGVDFPKAVVAGLRQRLKDAPPEAMARVTLILNTERMARRITQILQDGPPGFHPRLLLLSQVETLLTGPRPPAAMDALPRQFQLMQLVARLAERQRYLAPQSSVYALTQSLSQLIDEMQGEGVPLDRIETLDVSNASQHWQSTLAFLKIAHEFAADLSDGPDPLQRQRDVVQALVAQWQAQPPQHPILLAGSTGSRGTTALLMEAVAQLPQGAVLLPGVDPHMADDVWAQLKDPLQGEDHPQYRFARLQRQLGRQPGGVPDWAHDMPPASAARNQLVSLALRPAPVTDAWLREGPKLNALPEALEHVTMVQAPSPRAEANAIALRLRQAVKDNKTAALITPDRMLTRQVTAALDRWGITPDDSAGEPLHLSPPGRFLRHVAALFLRPLDAESLLVLLKHPLTNSGPDKGDHGLFVQLLEGQLRADRAPFPDGDKLRELTAKAADALDDPVNMRGWGDWVAATFAGRHQLSAPLLNDWVETHIALAERIAQGTSDNGNGRLWDGRAGDVAARAIAKLRAAAPHGGDLHARDYLDVLRNVLAAEEVRDPEKPHPQVLIWGTLEARVQGADLMILAGLNEGSWPETPAPDPWLNRTMRAEAGLLLPERRVGLSAHDFQQAIAAPEVWITRATRSDDAETVPSRWINRLTNLLSGLPAQNGPQLLTDMIQRGDEWLSMAVQLEEPTPLPPAKRPSPCPPISARPRQLSVTEIQTLIRDPYAIYARHCLRLNALDPLVQEPDAAIRGTLVHEIMEQFIAGSSNADDLTPDRLMEVAEGVLATQVPWPTTRSLWRARLARITTPLVTAEQERYTRAQPALLEEDAKGRLPLDEINMHLTARADRIDLTPDGQAWLYDYKSGHLPGQAEQHAFDKQLLLQALMIEAGGFAKLGARGVAGAAFIGVGARYKEEPAPLEDEPPAVLRERLTDLLGSYQQVTTGYTARARMQKDTDTGRYDHLARFGEWDETDDPDPEALS